MVERRLYEALLLVAPPQDCLRSVLENIAAYGQAVCRLQSFIDEVTGYSSDPGPPGSSSRKGSDPPFRTYQAFVWALNKYFTSFKQELTTIEKELVCNGKYTGGYLRLYKRTGLRTPPP